MARKRTTDGSTVPAEPPERVATDGRDAPTPRTLPPEERRAQLLAAAEAVVLAKGVAATSVAEIVATAGVAKGTFYIYFRTKDDVINALAELWTGQWLAAGRAIVSRPELGPLEKLLALFANRVVSRTDPSGRQEFWRHIHRPEHHQFHDALAAMISHDYALLVEQTIREGISDGTFTTPSPNEAAVLVVATLIGTELMLDPTAPDFQPKRWRDGYLAFVLRGLGCTVSSGDIEALVDTYLDFEMPQI